MICKSFRDIGILPGYWNTSDQWQPRSSASDQRYFSGTAETTIGNGGVTPESNAQLETFYRSILASGDYTSALLVEYFAMTLGRMRVPGKTGE